MVVSMLTTVDNPYDPFDQFDQWLVFDLDSHYNSSALLDRIAKTSDALSDEENNRIIEQAIDEIVLLDPLNIYKKISREVPEDSP